MPSAARYSRLITLQRADKEHTAPGTIEVWTDVRTFHGSCEYATQLFKPADNIATEGETTWVIRTRSDILKLTRDIGRYRYKCRIRGDDYIFFPKEFPIYKGGEWRQDCREEEDILEIDAGVAEGAGRGPF